MQSKTTSKFLLIAVLVAMVLLTCSFGCIGMIAYADGGPTVTYHVTLDGTTYQTLAEENIYYGKALVPHKLAWFKFGTWYTDAARTNVAPTVVYQSNPTSINLYCKCTFDVGNGDVNGDGKVNANDAAIYCRYLVGGYENICVVDAGDELRFALEDKATWDAKTYAEEGAATQYFLERVGNVYSDEYDDPDYPCDLSDIIYVQMAITGGYGCEVVENFNVSKAEIVVENSAINRVYYHNVQNWTDVKVYAWNDAGKKNAEFPGVAMTVDSGHSGWYYIDLDYDYSEVIFNDGSGTNKTRNLMIGEERYFNYGEWCSGYDDMPDEITVYYDKSNTSGWGDVYCYAWDGSKNNSWPGVKMTPMGGNWYYAKVSSSYTQVIFDNGSGGNGNQIGGFGLNLEKPYYKYNAIVTAPPDRHTIYFQNNKRWSNVNAHAWEVKNGADTGQKNGGWPGAPMQKVPGTENTYYVEVVSWLNMVVFSNNGSNQTGDLDAREDYNMGVFLSVDGMQLEMVPNTSDGSKYQIYIYLERGQVVYTSRFGYVQTFDSHIGFSGTSYTVQESRMYWISSESNKCWVQYPPE